MINKKVGICFAFALLLTIGFPCGIVLIILCYSTPLLLTFGIILTVLGFYGAPMLWVKFGEYKSKQKICNQIVLDNLHEVEYLAKLNSVDNQVMLDKLRDLITNRYLVGYEIVDDKYIVKQTEKAITKNEALTLAGKTAIVPCKGCGAPVEMVEGEKVFCPYCGRPINK